MSDDIKEPTLYATVPVEMLERLLYATATVRLIEEHLLSRKHDPLAPEKREIGEAFGEVDRIARHARRAAANYAGWNDPLTEDEVVTLLTLCEVEGVWEITAAERFGTKPGQPNTLDGLLRRGMVELGVPCKGVKWGTGTTIPWIADPTRFAVRVTARGRTAAQLVNEQKGKS